MGRISKRLSGWSVAAAFLLCASKPALAEPPEDNTPPTPPGNLVAAAVSGSQINLSWTPAFDQHQVTYGIYRCQNGGSCAGVVGSISALSYADTGLASGVTYTYYVGATDGWGNTGDPAVASATTFDVVAPSAPGTLSATAVSSSQINLSWSASSDNVGVSGYLVEMCAGAGCGNFAQIAGTGATSHSVTGLMTATSYSFRVRAYDAVPNYGDYSPVASAATPDAIPPGAPSSLTATAASGTQINLSWSAANDNVGVAAYLIERCQGSGCAIFSQIASTGSTSYAVTGLTPATSYSFRVRAHDAAPNYGGYSPTASATTPDTVAPSTPGALTATAASGTQINLTWSASSDNVGVSGYAIDAARARAVRASLRSQPSPRPATAAPD